MKKQFALEGTFYGTEEMDQWVKGFLRKLEELRTQVQIPSAHVKSQTLGHMLVSQHWGGGVRRSLEFIGQDILAKNMIPRFQ